MKAVIHQPYFLPWMGYFAKLIYADKFIVLDNVNFTKGSFIDRAQVINAQGEVIWIGMRVGQQFREKCNDIVLSDTGALERIIKTLHSAYARARHFREGIGRLESILMDGFNQGNKLSEINLRIITGLMQMLDIRQPKVHLSSEFPERVDATDRLIELLSCVDCDQLITGSGGSLTKHDLKRLTGAGITVLLQDYFNRHPVYYQTRRSRLGFAKGLSIVDCILNEGVEGTRQLLMTPEHSPELYLAQE